jgi:hypothetical protein
MGWLVVVAEGDESGKWAAERLVSAGLVPLVVLTDAELVGATWEHRVGNDGAVSRLTLGDGRVVESGEISGTLNRLQVAPPSPLAAEDREYGFHEISALLMSWLASLPGPVLNPPDTRGLAGAWRPPAEWAALAAEAGLRAAPVTVDSDRDWLTDASGWRSWPPNAPVAEDVIVVGEAVFAAEPLDEATIGGCRRLAALARTPLLGLVFACATCGGSPEVVGATPLPDLRAGGDEVIEALAVALRGERNGWIPP